MSSTSYNSLNNLLSTPLPLGGSSSQYSNIADNYLQAAKSLGQVTNYSQRAFNDMNAHIEAGRNMVATMGSDEANKYWTNQYLATSYTSLYK